MKKKNLNIILIIAVGLIWGILIYKYVNNMFTSDEVQGLVVTNAPNFEMPSRIKKDTFELKGYERDPFLGKISRRRAKVIVNNSSANVKRKKQSAVPKAVAPWPQIQYIGYVKEEHSKNPLLLLKISGKFLRKKADQEFMEGLKIKEFYKDSIIVQYSKEEKTIKKQ